MRNTLRPPFNFALGFLVAGLCSCREKPVQRADNDFDVRVAKPTFASPHPVILFDESHNNFHTTTGLYRPFATLAHNDGYEIRPLKTQLGQRELAGADLMIIANAKGGGEVNDEPAFTSAECDLIRDWVNDGGALLLVADHFPFGSAAQILADRFDVEFQKGMVEDPRNYDLTAKDSTQLVFSRENKLLGEHEITRGIDRVVTFTGQSLKCHRPSSAFLSLSDTAIDLRPHVEVRKHGQDTQVTVTYGNPRSARGRAQGVAFSFGKGRVVVLGEAAAITAQKDREGNAVGFNCNPGNKQLALNILHWLSSRPSPASSP